MNEVTLTSAMATQTTNAEPRIELRIPPTMQAAVYRGVNDMRVETVPVPAIGPGELLVKVATCGVCGTDLFAGRKRCDDGVEVQGHLSEHWQIGESNADPLGAAAGRDQ